jgi:hypothetical protein
LAQKIKASQFKADQAKLNLGYTQITAPDDGTIARKSIEPGMVIPPGQALFGFVSSKERWVEANLKETQIPPIRPGQKVEVKVDAIPGRAFEGEVDSLGSAPGQFHGQFHQGGPEGSGQDQPVEPDCGGHRSPFGGPFGGRFHPNSLNFTAGLGRWRTENG